LHYFGLGFAQEVSLRLCGGAQFMRKNKFLPGDLTSLIGAATLVSAIAAAVIMAGCFSYTSKTTTEPPVVTDPAATTSETTTTTTSPAVGTVEKRSTTTFSATP
jgi:hypothetical protein